MPPSNGLLLDRVGLTDANLASEVEKVLARRTHSPRGRASVVPQRGVLAVVGRCGTAREMAQPHKIPSSARWG